MKSTGTLQITLQVTPSDGEIAMTRGVESYDTFAELSASLLDGEVK